MSTAIPRACFESFFEPSTFRKLKQLELFARMDVSSSALYSSMSTIRWMG